MQQKHITWEVVFNLYMHPSVSVIWHLGKKKEEEKGTWLSAMPLPTPVADTDEKLPWSG